jgi:hypothetical protein
MSLNQPFKSAGLTTLQPTTLNVTVTSAAPIPGDGENIVVINDTGASIYFDVSTNPAFGMTQANANYVMGKNQRAIITVGRGIAYYVAVNPVTTIGGNSIYFMRGDGSNF